MPGGFEVLYDRGMVLAVSKPPGVLTQAPPGIDSLEVRVRSFLAERAAEGAQPYLAFPHRLDRPASGAMVLATHIRAARKLSKQFQRRTVEKTYWACVQGTVSPAEGTWRDVMRKVPGMPRGEIVEPTHPEGQSAVLHYRTLGTQPWGTWLEIILETGRTHQVRVQAAVRGHPVLGDKTYGCELPFGEQFEDVRLRAIALHARRVVFEDPADKQRVEVVAQVGEAWRSLGIDVS